MAAATASFRQEDGDEAKELQLDDLNEGEQGSDGQPKLNQLRHAHSPYLQQHATNPVDWYEWGEEAFAESRRRNVPVLLSVGYHSCHWCGVMERECFQNPEIAQLMNEWFVNIKVDRQERPDVDSFYMSFVVATTGHGGWPMTVWLTPSLRPIVGGTYFPPKDRGPMNPGLPRMLATVHRMWSEQAEALEEQSEGITAELVEGVLMAGLGGDKLPEDRWLALQQGILAAGLKDLAQGYDAKHGGFGDAPKFPTAVSFAFLLQVAAETRRDPRVDPDGRALAMMTHTLDKVRRGGVVDHVGHGFFRYSVTADWAVPHFEKMIYQQSQLAEVYLEAFRLTQNPDFERVARETLDYALAPPVCLPGGGFISAESADSQVIGSGESGSAAPSSNGDGQHHHQETKEGAFYVWKASEIDELVAEPEIFRFVYGVQAAGNVPHAADHQGELTGLNHLKQAHTFEEAANRYDRDVDEVHQIIAAGLAALKKYREAHRQPPPCDDQVLTGWNGMMISALARAGALLEEPRYTQAAVRCAQFIQMNLYDEENNRLWRSWRDGKHSRQYGFADDYADLIRGLLDLYDATFDPAYIQWALKLQERLDSGFWDSEKQNGYFNSGKDADPNLIHRTIEREDNATPAPSSVAAWNLLRLDALLHRDAFSERARAIFQAFGSLLSMAPGRVCPTMSGAVAASHAGFRQVVVQGDPEDDRTKALVRVLRTAVGGYNAVVAFDGGASEAFFRQASEELGYFPEEFDEPRVFVCQNFACGAPVSSPDELAKVLGQ